MEQHELSNYLPLNRKFFNHFFWKEERSFSKSEAWLYLISVARFEDSEASALIGGKLVKWNRGEVPCSLRYLSKAWGWSKNKADDFLKLLEKEKMISKRTAEGTCQTIITLCNYVNYNGTRKKGGQQKGQQEDSERTDGRRRRDETNIDNKVKKEEEGYTQQSSVPAHTDFELESFKQFNEWIMINAPRVASMKEPFTITQYLHVAKKYCDQPGEIRSLLSCMHNWVPLLKRNRSAYVTLLNWKRRDEGN